jgi:hypothetical protein
MPIRSCLLVAVGAAAGIAAASLSPRPAAPPPPPQIGVRTGHVEGGEGLRLLLPQSIRVDDQITQLGPPDPAAPEKALVYLDVNGVPVLIALAVGPNPGNTLPPSDAPLRPAPAAEGGEEPLPVIRHKTAAASAVHLP